MRKGLLAGRFAVVVMAGFGVLGMLVVVAGCQSSNDAARGGSMLESSPPSDGSGKGDGARKVSALLDEYTQALLDKDVYALDRIWAEDLTFVNPRGEQLTKRNRMDNITSGATAFRSIRLTDKQIRVYRGSGEGAGDAAAVATFNVALDAQYSAQEGSGDYRVTTTWARPKGAWQMVAVHMTKIVPPGAAEGMSGGTAGGTRAGTTQGAP